MPILAPTSTAPVTDPRFVTPNEGQKTVGAISSVQTTVIVQEHQLAYSGYKDNIDAFLASTAIGTKLFIENTGYPVTPSAHNFPLPLPRLSISIEDTIPKELAAGILKKWEGAGMTIEQYNEGNKMNPRSFVITNPTFKAIEGAIKISKESFPKSTGTCVPKGGMSALIVYHCIELYLRTNTYPAFRQFQGDEMEVDLETRSAVAIESQLKRPLSELRSVHGKRLRYGNAVTIGKAVEDGGEGIEEGTWIRDEDEEFLQEVVNPNNTVSRACPGGRPTSEGGFSSPSQCPKLPGIAFEYFEGMLIPDAAYIRSQINRFYIRCMGKNPKDLLVKFRQAVGDFATTPQGIICAHILKGMEISLEAQGQLHLLFDRQTYLGFVVFGVKWAIQVGGMWFKPESSTSLATTLERYQTHESTVVEVVELLKSMKILAPKAKAQELSGIDIAKMLAKVSFKGEDEEEGKRKIKELENMVARLKFGTHPLSVSEGNLAKAIRMSYAGFEGEESSIHVHFPRFRHYGIFESDVGIAMSQFGPTAPSFVVPKGGTKFRIDEAFGKMTPQQAKEEKAKIGKIFIAIKPLHEAVTDMQAFLKNPGIFTTCAQRSSIYQMVSPGKEAAHRWLNALIPACMSIPASFKEVEHKEPIEEKKAMIKELTLDDF
jgi:hypothetical protein